MTDRTASISLVAALCAAIFAGAFLIAPYSCRGGLGVYLLLGVVVTLVFLAIPFTLGRTMLILTRVVVSLGLAVLGVVVWTGGLFAANVSILCRLF